MANGIDLIPNPVSANTALAFLLNHGHGKPIPVVLCRQSGAGCPFPFLILVQL